MPNTIKYLLEVDTVVKELVVALEMFLDNFMLKLYSMLKQLMAK